MIQNATTKKIGFALIVEKVTMCQPDVLCDETGESLES